MIPQFNQSDNPPNYTLSVDGGRVGALQTVSPDAVRQFLPTATNLSGKRLTKKP
jgi:hypothetical protein